MCAGEAVPPGSDHLAGEQYRKSTFISDEARSTGEGPRNVDTISGEGIPRRRTARQTVPP